MYFSGFLGKKRRHEAREEGVMVRLRYLRFRQTFQLQVSDTLSFQQIKWCSVGSVMGPFCITLRNLQQAGGG
jgi:hypothetical protein